MNKNHIWERKVSCSNSLNQTATHRQQLCQLTPTQYASFDKSAGKQTTVSTTKAKDFSHEGASSVLDFTVMLQTLLQTVLMNKWMTEPETNSLWTKQNHYMVSWIILTLFGHQWVFSDAMHSNERSDQCLVMSTSIYSPGGFCTTIKHSSFDSFSFEYMWQEKKSLWPYSGKLRVLQKIYSQISCLKTEVYYKARLYS